MNFFFIFRFGDTYGFGTITTVLLNFSSVCAYHFSSFLQEGRKTPGSGAHLPNGKAMLEEEEDEHTDETLVRTGR